MTHMILNRILIPIRLHRLLRRDIIRRLKRNLNLSFSQSLRLPSRHLPRMKRTRVLAELIALIKQNLLLRIRKKIMTLKINTITIRRSHPHLRSSLQRKLSSSRLTHPLIQTTQNPSKLTIPIIITRNKLTLSSLFLNLSIYDSCGAFSSIILP